MPYIVYQGKSLIISEKKNARFVRVSVRKFQRDAMGINNRQVTVHGTLCTDEEGNRQFLPTGKHAQLLNKGLPVKVVEDKEDGWYSYV
jgi:hypothetical protein